MLTTLHTTKKKSSSRSDKLFDRLVLFISILYPLSATPQLIAVFQGKADGVSVISWIAFLVCAGLFLAYGLRHKVWPMILSNTLWVVVDSLVVIGIMSYRI
ncbi:hypothetical protein D3C85_331520 [compost metagenome]